MANDIVKQNKLSSDDAFHLDQEIKQLRRGNIMDFWKMVHKLGRQQEGRGWVVLGHESWESYLAQPEIRIAPSTYNSYVSRYLTIYKYIKSLTGVKDLTRIDIFSIDPMLLEFDDQIARLIVPILNNETIPKDKKDLLISQAQTLSYSDIEKTVIELIPPPEPIVLPEGQFNVIYADPPWQYRFSETESRQIENQYPTLELEKIKSMQIPASENSILFLWATAPKLEEAMQVMLAWGFDYRTCAVWDKEIIGMGYWFRGQHELLLVGVKGNFPTPDEGKRVSSVYRERRGEHSVKPTYFYNLIETYFPNGKYLELFARNKHNDKWTVWGNEV